jgi:hypothetical protein
MSGVPFTPPSYIGGFEVGVSPIGGPILQALTESPGLLYTIPSYLYAQFQDDDNLQLLFWAYNQNAQLYQNWFNRVWLPVYTNPNIAGLLLDWVGQGIYGLVRPVLSSQAGLQLAAIANGFYPNQVYPNQFTSILATYYATDDDYYKRVLTWHVYKGDGKYFTVRWLKRRVMRFLVGANGTAPNVDQTYRVSVTFGPAPGQVNITIIDVIANVEGGAIPNAFAPNTMYPNQLSVSTEYLTPFPAAPIFKAAMDAGVLEMPFQCSPTVVTI